MSSPVTIEIENFKVSAKKLSGKITVLYKTTLKPKKDEPLVITIIPLKGSVPQLDDFGYPPSTPPKNRVLEVVETAITKKVYKTGADGKVMLSLIDVPWVSP